MSIDINMGVFLQNVRAAMINQQYDYALFLLDFAMKLAGHSSSPLTAFPLDISIGLHRGRVRAANEDCVLALQGVFSETRETIGLCIVADGMGGHAHGQEAARVAIQTMLDYVFPFLVGKAVPSHWESILVEGIHQANQAIYARNLAMEQYAGNGLPFPSAQGSVNTSHIARMGTTVTAVLLVGETAYCANVGDSRIYLYDHSLHRITTDHSVVAELLGKGILSEEEIYTHPDRNKITRSVGTYPSVDVDAFVVPLHSDALLLLCSDGLWEMTRNPHIEKVLASPWASASAMAGQLVSLANSGGGADNISCIVIQPQKGTDISTLETALLDPLGAFAQLVVPS